MGPALADRVAASEQARTRLKVLLETITGDKTMDEACRALGIQKTQLFKLRARVLEAAAAALEPGPVGRPPQTVDPQAARIAELETRIKQLEVELAGFAAARGAGPGLAEAGRGAIAAAEKKEAARQSTARDR